MTEYTFKLPITPSQYQADIFDHIAAQFEQIPGLKTPRQNATGIGVAGCGKTKTLEIGVQYFIPPFVKVLMVAYNAPIAAELKKRLPDKVVKTYHGLGLWAISNSIKNVRVEDETTGKKTIILLKRYLDRRMWGKFYGAIEDMVSAVKNGLLQDQMDDNTLYNLALDKGLDIIDVREVIFDAVRYVINESMNWTDFVSFDDMIWFPAIFDWIKVPQFQAIFVDELQDTDHGQRILIRKALAPDGFIMGIGDPAQSIYAWRGADVDAMDQFSADFQSVTLPLTITYRCPTSVVARVNQRWPGVKFEAAPNAIEGLIQTKHLNEVDFTPGTLAMCRTNAPLVPVAYHLIGQGIHAQIRGRDIGKGLRALIRQMAPEDLGDLLRKLVDYRDAETYKLKQADRPAAAQSVQDKVDTIIHLSSKADTLEQLDQRIGEIFTTKTAPVTLTTGHGAKGLEADNCIILRPDLLPLSYAKTPDQIQQESNLEYVINTRTRNVLTIVDD